MTEHEKLKWICDKIGITMFNVMKRKTIVKNVSEYDIREIIFTPEFREYLYDHLALTHNEIRIKEIIEEIIWHLEKPVDYIYNLINHE